MVTVWVHGFYFQSFKISVSLYGCLPQCSRLLLLSVGEPVWYGICWSEWISVIFSELIKSGLPFYRGRGGGRGGGGGGRRRGGGRGRGGGGRFIILMDPTVTVWEYIFIYRDECMRALGCSELKKKTVLLLCVLPLSDRAGSLFGWLVS